MKISTSMLPARLLTCALLCGLLLSNPLWAKDGATAPPGTPSPTPSATMVSKQVELGILPDKQVVMSGEPFYVTVTIINRSARSYPGGFPVWWHIILTVTGKDGGVLGRSYIPFGKGRPVPEIPAHTKITERLSLPGCLLRNGEALYKPGVFVFKQPGEYVITAHVEHWIEEVGESGSKSSVKVATGITVAPADAAKMGVLINDLGSRALSIESEGGIPNAGQSEAVSSLMMINDERAIPWLIKMNTRFHDTYMAASTQSALAKFPNEAVVKAAKEIAQPAPGAGPAPAAGPKPDEAALRKAVEAGDALLVRQLVMKGADIRPLAGADGLVAKFWTAPLDDAAIASEVSIQVPAHVKRDRNIPIHIEFKNTGDNTRFLNPDLDHDYYSPAGILLFDEKKRCIGDLFDFSAPQLAGGRNDGRSNPGWVEKGQVFETDSRFRIEARIKSQEEQDDEDSNENPPIHLAITNGKQQLHRIAPGRYYVQFVYWLRYIIPSPDAPGSAMAASLAPLKNPADKNAQFQKSKELENYYQNPIWRLPLYRSNAVAIDVE